MDACLLQDVDACLRFVACSIRMWTPVFLANELEAAIVACSISEHSLVEGRYGRRVGTINI